MCPQTGVRILPETNPVLGYVISDNGGSPWDLQYAIQTTLAILKHSKRVPHLFLEFEKNTAHKLLSLIDQWPQKTLIKSHLHFVDIKSSSEEVSDSKVMWQQDVFESYFSPKTGLPVIHATQKYTGNSDSPFVLDEAINPLVKSFAQVCPGIVRGENFPAGDSSRVEESEEDASGTYGGNIEALPGGLCLFGDGLDKKSALSFCGHERNEVQIKTSWLLVGHADELVSSLAVESSPVSSSGTQCKIHVGLASPERFLVLMQQHAQETIFEFDENAKAYLKTYFKIGTMTESPLRDLCLDLGKKCETSDDLLQIKGQDIVDLIRNNSKWRHSYELARSMMKQNKEIVFNKLHLAQPHCEIDFVEFPVLYREINLGTDQFPQKGLVAVVTNPVNNIKVEGTVVTGYPLSKFIAADLRDSLKKRNIEIDFVSTYPSLDSGFGSVHCGTHTLNLCRPR